MSRLQLKVRFALAILLATVPQSAHSSPSENCKIAFVALLGLSLATISTLVIKDGITDHQRRHSKSQVAEGWKGKPLQMVLEEALADTYSRDDLENVLKEIVVVVIDDRSAAALKNTAVGNGALTWLQEHLNKMPVNSVLYDIDFSGEVNNPQYNDFFRALQNGTMPIVSGVDNPIGAKTIMKRVQAGPSLDSPLVVGHAIAHGFKKEGDKGRSSTNQSWYHPDQKTWGLSILPIEDGLPSMTSSLFKSIHGNEVEVPIIYLEDRSERYLTKIPIQDLVRDETSLQRLNGKFIFIGGDFDKADSHINSDGEQYNGVFDHALSFALLQKYYERSRDPQYPSGKSLYLAPKKP